MGWWDDYIPFNVSPSSYPDLHSPEKIPLSVREFSCKRSELESAQQGSQEKGALIENESHCIDERDEGEKYMVCILIITQLFLLNMCLYAGVRIYLVTLLA